LSFAIPKTIGTGIEEDEKRFAHARHNGEARPNKSDDREDRRQRSRLFEQLVWKNAHG